MSEQGLIIFAEKIRFTIDVVSMPAWCSILLVVLLGVAYVSVLMVLIGVIERIGVIEAISKAINEKINKAINKAAVKFFRKDGGEGGNV